MLGAVTAHRPALQCEFAVSGKLLIACYETPGWGGAATVAYLLYERLRRDGIAHGYINLIARKDEAFLHRTFGINYGNPKNLPDVHNCYLDEPLWRGHDNLAAGIRQYQPDRLIGYGFIAGRLLQLAAPEIPVVMFTAGARQLSHLIESGAVKDFVSFCRTVDSGITYPMPSTHPERQAAEAAELLFIHSPLVRTAFDHLIPAVAGKTYANNISVADFIFAEAKAFAHLSRRWQYRDIDLLFIASDWSRPEKNYRLVRKIAKQTRNLRVHIVGKVHRLCTGAQHHGVIAEREKIYDLLGRTKALVCPSRSDAAPGILFEAAAMGCNVIASRNCGNWELCNARLLIEPFTLASCLKKIALAQTAPYAADDEKFRGGYRDLIETLQAL